MNLQQSIQHLLEYPLRILYFYGPSFSGYGFWEGLPKEEICSRLTSVDAAVWKMNIDIMSACEILIERKINSMLIFFGFILYCYLFQRIICLLLDVVRALPLFCSFLYCKYNAPVAPQIEKNAAGNTYPHASVDK